MIKELTNEAAKRAKAEGFAARCWREDIVKLTRHALGELTGYSVAHIQNFEKGVNISTGDPIKPRDMQRYRMVCACVMASLDFDWKTCCVDPRALTEAMISSKKMPERVE